MPEYVIMRQYDTGDTLEHFGIKGQKWGVRRYENPDGTLTPEGQKRYYGKLFEKESKKQERLNYKADRATQIRLAKDHATKAKQSAAAGLTGAAIAGAGYLETEIAKGMNGGKVPLSVERVVSRSKGVEHVSMHKGEGYQLAIGGLMDMTAGSAIAMVGLGKAAYHGIRASVAHYRASAAGHQKAALKAKEHLDSMKELFKNTPYANLVNKKFD